MIKAGGSGKPDSGFTVLEKCYWARFWALIRDMLFAGLKVVGSGETQEVVRQVIQMFIHLLS